MKREDLIGLMGAYGMELQFERPEEHKMRFKGNGTFLDVWTGKRGMTVGRYVPSVSGMTFHKRMDAEKLEGVLVEITKQDN